MYRCFQNLASRSLACRKKNYPPLELRRNKLGLRFLYKLKSNTSYIDTLNTPNDSDDQNYKENDKSIKLTGVYLKNWKQRYMEEQKEMN